MKEKPPRLSGVYQVLCIPNGKIYIGSTVNLRDRWGRHLWNLRRGNHRNGHLQNAWNKYGEAKFVFSVLEFVEKSYLLCTEQEWINKSRCTDTSVGFNIYHVAGSPGDKLAQTWEGLIDPNGNHVTIINLHEFCRQHNLDFASMCKLAKGKSKLKSYKGWTHRNSVRQRDYVKTYDGFMAPDGRPIGLITNLAAFCREHGLDNTHMVAVAHGRICSHRGWTYNGGKNKSGPKTYIGFINPRGQRVKVVNLSRFCREQGLHPVHMHQLKSGQRKSHKGWTWREGNE